MEYTASGGLVLSGNASALDIGGFKFLEFRLSDPVWVKNIGERNIIAYFFDGQDLYYKLNTGEIVHSDETLSGAEFSNSQINDLLEERENCLNKLESTLENPSIAVAELTIGDSVTTTCCSTLRTVEKVYLDKVAGNQYKLDNGLVYQENDLIKS